MSREPLSVPLKLWDQPHWELRGRVDSTAWFRVVPSILPEATTLFVEGTSIDDDVQAFLRLHMEKAPYLPARQTIWPEPLQFRVPATAAVFQGLVTLSENHAEPEIADHLFVYASASPLIEYPDAFADDSPLFVAGHLTPERAQYMAAQLGVRVVDVRGLTSECS